MNLRPFLIRISPFDRFMKRMEAVTVCWLGLPTSSDVFTIYWNRESECHQLPLSTEEDITRLGYAALSG